MAAEDMKQKYDQWPNLKSIRKIEYKYENLTYIQLLYIINANKCLNRDSKNAHKKFNNIETIKNLYAAHHQQKFADDIHANYILFWKSNQILILQCQMIASVA